ncbi:transglutaminase family protein [Paenibacillus daejeonensis]|uniref:transglutaminase family protein n=1 Tax=Paenibacillus daejeonensis TaxID=135193 RepID=UPI0003801F99|nr:transglutaminase family protein [Paenibacillus daejeonensis]
MKLKIMHVTEYTYAEPVTDSVNEVRLTPCTNEWQSCYQHAIAVEPNTPLQSYEDFFGNRVTAFSVNEPHTKLTIRTQMTVVTTEPGREREAERKGRLFSPAEAWAWLDKDEAQNRFAEYLLPTSYTTATPEVLVFAGMDERTAEEPAIVHEWLSALSERIRQEFTYDADATDVKTKVADMIGSKRGVCQDFAHLMITICRSRNIPARYVSGYQFIGDLQEEGTAVQHASHAWVEAYVPNRGWCSYDPTNPSIVGERYVKLGHGRDYKDIVPVKGVYRGSSGAHLDVSVVVEQLDG